MKSGSGTMPVHGTFPRLWRGTSLTRAVPHLCSRGCGGCAGSRRVPTGRDQSRRVTTIPTKPSPRRIGRCAASRKSASKAGRVSHGPWGR